MLKSASPVPAPGTSKENGYPRDCALCEPRIAFYDPAEFGRHLRAAHSTREGGSFVCRYGPNGVCQRLPLEGVSDHDYEAHIRKFHTAVEIRQVAARETDKMFTINRSVNYTNGNASRGDEQMETSTLENRCIE